MDTTHVCHVGKTSQLLLNEDPKRSLQLGAGSSEREREREPLANPISYLKGRCWHLLFPGIQPNRTKILQNLVVSPAKVASYRWVHRLHDLSDRLLNSVHSQPNSIPAANLDMGLSQKRDSPSHHGFTMG